jgi:hypothetical protein
MINPLIKNLLLPGAVLLLFNACSNEAKNTENEQLLVKADSTIEATVAEDLQEVTITLPSPLQLASIFKKSGLKFKNGITNSPKNVTKYNNTEFIRAVNLGIYSTDLAYVILNKQFDESKPYLRACEEVSTGLGMKKAFETNNLGERFVNNMGKEDSLVGIISEIQMQSDLLLEEHNQKYITAMAFTGAWFESVYIAGEVYKSDKNSNVCVSLMEQYDIAENIIKALDSYREKVPECQKLIDDVVAILGLFKSTAAIKNADPNVDLDFGKMTMTDEEFKALEAKVNEIRNSYVK